MDRELVQFVRDQLDDDAQDAEAAGDSWYGYEPEQQIAFVSVEDARHIARHSPARVLREVEAKRQILEALQDLALLQAPAAADRVVETMALDGIRRTLRLLALPYADRPGYREGWRP